MGKINISPRYGMSRSFDIGGSWRGKPVILENAYKCRRCVIDVTVQDPLSLVELGGGVQCFGEFGASGRARTMKIGSRVRKLNKST